MLRNQAKEKCAQPFVVDSEVSIKYLKNDPLTRESSLDDPIQLRPQRISMTNVRKGRHVLW